MAVGEVFAANTDKGAACQFDAAFVGFSAYLPGGCVVKAEIWGYLFVVCAAYGFVELCKLAGECLASLWDALMKRAHRD